MIVRIFRDPLWVKVGDLIWFSLHQCMNHIIISFYLLSLNPYRVYEDFIVCCNITKWKFTYNMRKKKKRILMTWQRETVYFTITTPLPFLSKSLTTWNLKFSLLSLHYSLSLSSFEQNVLFLILYFLTFKNKFKEILPKLIQTQKILCNSPLWRLFFFFFFNLFEDVKYLFYPQFWVNYFSLFT